MTRKLTAGMMMAALGFAALAQAGPVVSPAAPASPRKAHAARAAGAARLDEVHIKGEIPGPQVLFVVGRERRRYLESQHRRYLVAPAGEAARPAWIRVIDAGWPAPE